MHYIYVYCIWTQHQGHRSTKTFLISSSGQCWKRGCEWGDVFYGVTVSTVRGDVLRSGGVRGYTVQITRERFKPTTSDIFPSADPFDRLMERKIEHTEKKYKYISIPIDEIRVENEMPPRPPPNLHLPWVFSSCFSLSASRGLKTNNAVNREGTLSLSLSISLNR